MHLLLIDLFCLSFLTRLWVFAFIFFESRIAFHVFFWYNFPFWFFLFDFVETVVLGCLSKHWNWQFSRQNYFPRSLQFDSGLLCTATVSMHWHFATINQLQLCWMFDSSLWFLHFQFGSTHSSTARIGTWACLHFPLLIVWIDFCAQSKQLIVDLIAMIVKFRLLICPRFKCFVINFYATMMFLYTQCSQKLCGVLLNWQWMFLREFELFTDFFVYSI